MNICNLVQPFNAQQAPAENWSEPYDGILDTIGHTISINPNGTINVPKNFASFSNPRVKINDGPTRVLGSTLLNTKFWDIVSLYVGSTASLILPSPVDKTIKTFGNGKWIKFKVTESGVEFLLK